MDGVHGRVSTRGQTRRVSVGAGVGVGEGEGVGVDG